MKEPSQNTPESPSETSPLVEGLGTGALVSGVGAAAQAIWEHTAGHHKRLETLDSIKSNADCFIWWDDHHIPEWKELIIEPFYKQAGTSSEAMRKISETAGEMASKEIDDIHKALSNSRTLMAIGTALAAVVFGGLVYAQARKQQETSQVVPSPQIDPQGLHHSPLKKQPVTPERT